MSLQSHVVRNIHPALVRWTAAAAFTGHSVALGALGCSGSVGEDTNPQAPFAAGSVPSPSLGDPLGSNAPSTAGPGGVAPGQPSVGTPGTITGPNGEPIAVDPNTGLPLAPSPIPSETDPAAPAEGPQQIPATPPGVDNCTPDAVESAGITKLRRLTRLQLSNTLRDLVGVGEEAVERLVEDEHMGPFYSNSNAPPDELIVRQHQEVAVAVAAAAVPSMSQLSGCDLQAGSGCAETFVREFGAKAYRRPLSEEEVSELVSLFELGSETSTENGFRLVLQALLQAPSFIYHVETGSEGVPSSAPIALSAYGLASRLSYFLWDSMPDEGLFARAADGSLSQPAILSAEVDRMLLDEKARDTIGLFFAQLLGVTHIAEADTGKDTTVFPRFSESVAHAMLEETRRFTSSVVLDGDSKYRTLLTADFGYPSQELLELYGVEAPSGFQEGDSVPLTPGERRGMLTQLGFLTAHAKRNATSPVHRGIVVRENLLCQLIPPPPMNVVPNLPESTDFETTRERFAIHLEDPSCATCHTLMDPLGLAFENYDGIGVYRTLEGQNPIDASGTLTALDVEGSFANAVEMVDLLAESRIASDCMATQWFRFALGRVESVDDACSMQGLQENFVNSDGNVLELLRQITTSYAFNHIRSTAEEL